MAGVAYLIIAIVIVVLAAAALGGLLLTRARGTSAPLPPSAQPPLPGVGDDAEVPRDSPTRSIARTVELPAEDVSAAPAAPVVAVPELDRPEPTAGRLVRLRERLSRSQTTLGRGLLSVLSRDKLDDDAWDEVSDSLLIADVGVAATGEIVSRLQARTRVLGTRSQGELRALLADELVAATATGPGPLPAHDLHDRRTRGGHGRGRQRDR